MSIIIASFIFGLFVGSFVNVVVHRMDSGKPIIFDRSRCLNCARELSWYELIPLVSFVIQRARCRSCKERISWQYPIMELVTGILFAFILWHTPIAHDSIRIALYVVFEWAIASGLLIIFVYDLKHYIIPDSVLVFLIITTLIAILFGVWNLEFVWKLPFIGWSISDMGLVRHLSDIRWIAAATAIVSGVVAALPFAAISIFSKGEWMGLGDPKLVFFMGLLLGPQKVLVALFLSVIIGAVFGLVLIALGKKSMQSQIPFGPFLIIGTAMANFWGMLIYSSYINLFLAV
ncbi:MAG: prepilin peptidase [Candidatus Spechtbacteria bacterium]|nr:prepilin peptidase [Candidatus Spechtbacteria bacterium]